MPVVGAGLLPFFFSSLSYGLSSLFVNLTAVGLLMSVARRKHRAVF